MPDSPSVGSTGNETVPFDAQELIEQLMMQVIFFGPVMDALEEDREGEE